jgi:hypothetical protein
MIGGIGEIEQEKLDMSFLAMQDMSFLAMNDVFSCLRDSQALQNIT